MKDLKDIKEICSYFIERRVEVLKRAKNGKELELYDIHILCDQIIEFMYEHFGNVPEAFYQKLRAVYFELQHVLMDKNQPPFMTGGIVCPSPFSLPSKLINSFRSTDKAIKALFKKIVEEQLDEMWPEYKDRWKD